jgi:hypothetical protein
MKKEELQNIFGKAALNFLDIDVIDTKDGIVVSYLYNDHIETKIINNHVDAENVLKATITDLIARSVRNLANIIKP